MQKPSSVICPVPVINGFDTNGTFGSQGAGSVIIDRNDNYRAAGTLTKISGNHTFKFGGEFLRLTHNYAQTNTPSGIFNFDPGFTSANLTTPQTAAWASRHFCWVIRMAAMPAARRW